MMASIETVMSEFYDVLFKLRYPEILKAESKNVGSIILTGENRIRLLSWLLVKRLPQIESTLTELEGSALEDELVKCYTGLGICNDKSILLGNCTLNKQLPMLNLILEFIKNSIDEFDVPCSIESMESMEELTNNLFKAHLENLNDVGNTAATLHYSEAVDYFENLKQLVDEPNKDIEIPSITEKLSLDTENVNNQEHTENYISQMKKFKDAYGSVTSWPVSNPKIKNIEYNMNKDIKKMHSNFMILKEMLHMKNEIPKLVIPQAQPNNSAPLSSVVEETVICLDSVISEINAE